MKTPEDIIDDIFDFLKTTDLPNNVTGKIRADGKREPNSKLEDVTISVVASTSGDVQRAVCYVNVFVADQYRGKQYTRDRGRVSALCRICADIFEDDVHYNDFWLWDYEQSITEIETSHEWMISNRFIYQVANK